MAKSPKGKGGGSSGRSGGRRATPGAKKRPASGAVWRSPVRRRAVAPDGTLVSARPASVGDILKALVRKTPLGQQLQQAQIWDKWEEIAGEKLAAHGRPHSIKGKTLMIEVDSSVWMNFFSYNKWEILKRINQGRKRELVSDIFILLTPEAERQMEGEK